MALYPTSLSLISARAATLDGAGAGEPHSVIHDEIEDEIEAIAAELGTSPSGSDATVAARLARVDAATIRDTQALTLASGVTNSGGGFASGAASKAGGIVTVSGKLSNTSGGNIASGTAIAQVYAGFEPVARLSFTCWSGAAGAILVDVLANGQIVVVSYTWPNGDYISLSGISFVSL